METEHYQPLGVGVGTLINQRYEVTRRLGAGGMSVVFEVRDRALNNELMALKLFEPKLTDDETLVERFRNEVVITRKLTHPNIVRTFDFAHDGKGNYFLTMEFIDGPSLADVVKGYKTGSPPPFDEVVRVLYEISNGAAHAHKENVIHRDLKPANVLLNKQGAAKIADFGLALKTELNIRLTQTGHCVGTPSYMAPEQILEKEADHRVDVYAFGIIAFELATGRVPFGEKSWYNLANQIVADEIPKISTLGSNIPRWYEEMVFKAAAKSPESHFHKMEEISDLLKDHLSGDGPKISLGNYGYQGAPIRATTKRNFSPRQTTLLLPQIDLYGLAPKLLFASLVLAALLLAGTTIAKRVETAKQGAQVQIKNIQKQIGNLEDMEIKTNKFSIRIEGNEKKVQQKASNSAPNKRETLVSPDDSSIAPSVDLDVEDQF